MAIGVGKDGYLRVLGVQEGHKEDTSGRCGFLSHLKQRGLLGVLLIISDACLGLVESVAEYYPDADWERCMVHFYRNVFSHVPSAKVRQVALKLKAIHAQESLQTAQAKAAQVIESLRTMKMKAAANLVEAKIDETLTYYHYPQTHWVRIRTNNPLERIMREFRRRTRVVGAFPDGNSALMLVGARLRHISGTKAISEYGSARQTTTGESIHCLISETPPNKKCGKFLTLPEWGVGRLIPSVKG